MKALVYLGQEQLDYRDIPDAVPDRGEVLVKIDSVGICGSDMHAFLGHDARRPPPLVLGHEAAGTVVEGDMAGQRVTINPLVCCGICPSCRQGRQNLCPNRQIISMPPRQGAFGELLAMPLENLVPVPPEVTLERAALTECLACGWHAVRLARQRCSLALEDARCLVFGGGSIGLGAALALQAHGVGEVTILEPNPLRQRTLKAMERLRVLPSLDHNEASSFDVIIDGVGLEVTRAVASGRANPGAVIVHIGLGDGVGGLDIRRMTLQEISFIGAYTYTPEDFRETAQAIFEGHLGPLDWHQVRPLSEGPKAFADIREGRVASPKVILKP